MRLGRMGSWKLQHDNRGRGGGSSAAPEGGKLEAAARLRRARMRGQHGSGARAGSRPQHGSGGRSGGSQP